MTYQAMVNDATTVLNATTAPAAIEVLHYGSVLAAGQVRHRTIVRWIDECLKPVNDLLASSVRTPNQYAGVSYTLHRKLGMIDRGDPAGHTKAMDFEEANEVFATRKDLGADSFGGFLHPLMVVLVDRGVELSDDNPFAVDLYETKEDIERNKPYENRTPEPVVYEEIHSEEGVLTPEPVEETPIVDGSPLHPARIEGRTPSMPIAEPTDGGDIDPARIEGRTPSLPVDEQIDKLVESCPNLAAKLAKHNPAVAKAKLKAELKTALQKVSELHAEIGELFDKLSQ